MACKIVRPQMLCGTTLWGQPKVK